MVIFSPTTTKGFTLIETLVAVLIFSIALTGLLLVVTRGIGSANDTKNELIAEYLALEGYEMVRNMRDRNFVYNLKNDASASWLSGLAVCDGGACYPELISGLASWSACSAGACPQVYFQEGAQRYNQSGTGSPTLFTRRVELVPGGSSDERFVESEVTWTEGGQPRRVFFRGYITNWEPPVSP